MTTVLIIAGGTGGHVYPALAVAQELRTQGVSVVWAGTRKGLEARVVPAAGFEIEWITIRGLRRTGWLSWLLMPLRLVVAMFQSWRILRRRRPDAVLAMGGFVAAPGGLTARMLRRPLLIHEQNAVAGLTNRWLAYIADTVMCGFPEAFGTLPGARHVGNPVRSEILALPLPAERLSDRTGPLRVLVIGGSQGAIVFNRIMPQAVAKLSHQYVLEIWHQTGKTERERTEHAYRRTEAKAKVTAFIDDMAQAYAWADVLVCRAGAMTIAELAAAGVAAILVPYPHAVDDHQTANARFLSDRDAAVLVTQGEFSAQRIEELLAGFAANRELLLRLASNARACAVPDATEAVARLCLEAANA
ncbi:MAG: undecaprenyldiphospho-muramoylpentapeptide beta-N-acetylglucosaminyltransferase [Acidiferrobacterales bacterium]